jgi:2-dehydropantoate 2-reductase
MRVLVVGTGALGGYYGGLLARAGHDVTFLARGERLEKLRREGMRVESALSGNFQVSGRFTDNPEEASTPDLVLFTVKSYDTRQAAEAVRPHIGPQTMVLCLLNGVENEEILGEAVGHERVLAGAARIEATVDDDGTVKQLGPNHRVDFGEWGRPNGDRTQSLLEELKTAGIDAYLDPDARLALWRKFIFLCPTAALTAATSRSIGEVATMPETKAVLERAVDEIYRVAKAEGVPLPDNAVETTMDFISKMPFGMRSSLQRDLERGRRVEIDALSGAVVRLGEKHQIDTPIHLTLLACVKARAANL